MFRLLRRLRGYWLIHRGNLKVIRGGYLVEKGEYLVDSSYDYKDDNNAAS